MSDLQREIKELEEMIGLGLPAPDGWKKVIEILKEINKRIALLEKNK